MLWVTILFSILVNVRPLVLNLSLALFALSSDHIEITLVARSSRLTSDLTDCAFCRVSAFRTLLAVVFVRVFINVEECIGGAHLTLA